MNTSLRLDIICSVFAWAMMVLIMFGVHLLFWGGGMGAQADRNLVHKGLPVLGFLAVRDIYRYWKKYKSEQSVG